MGTPAQAAGAPDRRARWRDDLLRNLFVRGADNYALGSGGQKQRYRVLRRYVVLSTAFVAVGPLLVLTILSYHQYERAYRAELYNPIIRLTSTTSQTVEFFLAERRSALEMVVHEVGFDELSTSLDRVLANLAHTFGGFVDLGLIDAGGTQQAYAGPYQLTGKDYADQRWFQEVQQQGVYVSSVFLGHRGIPHFVIAVKQERPDESWYVLRATVDSDELTRRIRGPAVDFYSDAFLVNRDGLLQTPSHLFGEVLQQLPLPLPAETRSAGAVEVVDEAGWPVVMGYAPIARSPFVFILTHRPHVELATWHTVRRQLLTFSGISVIVILSVIWVGSTYMIKRVRDADRRRAEVLHQAEYTAKMATVGRLAAGVAHEVNNPLAIINEKAGLLQDLIEIEAEVPQREKLLGLAAAVIASVERASRVTHRLLGFARHVEVCREPIALAALIEEVIGFLEREALYRNLQVAIDADPDVPEIVSDRGQLQQVFLNILNNAFTAVADGVGRIDVCIRRTPAGGARVAITDNGVGIERENLPHIFEPFFTTKKGYGTGLGLSVTYGIVQKLGGAIEVESELGSWTTFTVTLPDEAPPTAGGPLA